MSAWHQCFVRMFLAAPLLFGLAIGTWPLPCLSQEENEDSRVEPSKDKPEAARRLKLLGYRAAKVHPWSRPDTEQPILRYSDAEAGQLDGAIFVFCHGTNREVLLVLEATQKPEKPPTWQFGFARNTIAELRVELDGKEVWTQPYIRFADAGSSDPFFIAVEPFDADELEQLVEDARR